LCTIVVLIRPGHAWPVALAANRDEQCDRAWDPPAAWWPDRPGVIAGRDRTGGIAGVLNRPGSLGPAPGKCSRGKLPLIALEHPSAEDAASAITQLDAGAWRSFNMLLADRRGAIFLRGLGRGSPTAHPLPPGLHMITAHDPDDLTSPRVARHLPRFRAVPPPEADQGRSWLASLADRTGSAADQINVKPRAGFGTVCSSFIALPEAESPTWLFAAGPPDAAPFLPVELETAS
jgi:hypothetical protein